MTSDATPNMPTAPQIAILVPGRWHAFDYARELGKRGQLSQLITPYPRFEIIKYGVPPQAIVSLWWLEVLRRASLRITPRLPLNVATKVNVNVSLAVLRQFARQAAARLKPCDVVVAWSSCGTPSFQKAQGWKANWPSLRVCERLSSHIRVQEALLAEEHKLQALPWQAWDKRLVNLELDDYRYADVIATPSQFAKHSFIQEGFTEDRLIQVTPGTDLGTFYPLAEPTNGKDGKFRVIYAGSLNARKGISYLVQGYLTANLPASELWLVGSKAAETDRLLNTTDPRVQLRGHFPQSELVNLYNQASVFVIASIEEGNAYVQTQALACGLPLICTTNTGGADLLRIGLAPGQEPLHLPDGIEQYPAGFVVPIRRPDCIAACLRQLQADLGLQQAMRVAALRIAAAELDWGHYTTQILSEYQQAITKLRRPVATTLEKVANH